jgi:hypothetical protein
MHTAASEKQTVVMAWDCLTLDQTEHVQHNATHCSFGVSKLPRLIEASHMRVSAASKASSLTVPAFTAASKWLGRKPPQLTLSPPSSSAALHTSTELFRFTCFTSPLSQSQTNRLCVDMSCVRCIRPIYFQVGTTGQWRTPRQGTVDISCTVIKAHAQCLKARHQSAEPIAAHQSEVKSPVNPKVSRAMWWL